MRVVALDGDVFEVEGVELGDGGVERERRERPRLTGELEPGLLDVVGVEVCVAQRVHEVADLETSHLGNHVREQGVGGDVERHAEEDVGAALVELAGQPALGDVELEHRVAGRQRHLRDVGDVPRADDVPAAVGVAPDLLDDLGDLVDVPTVRGRPRAPLVAVDRPEVAVVVGPLVPDRDAAVLEPLDVGVASEEPQQLGEDRPGVHLLRGDQREALAQVESHLVAEDALRPGAGAVVLLGAGVEDQLEEVEVLPHARDPTP